MTTAHASKTKIANASNDKSRIFGPHYSPTHQTASLSERIIASGGTGADRRSNTGAPLRSPAAARSPGSSQPYSRHLKATGALAHQLLALLVRQVSGYAAAYSPELSTMEEGGVSGVNQTAWQGVFSAPRMPQPLRERIAREVFAITSDPAYQQKLRQSGFEPLPLDGAATERMYREELRQWTALIKERALAGR